ncbi:hypothetical protein KKA14_01215, partial [bacterium]|nr:hypothetical protein [bacterium]
KVVKTDKCFTTISELNLVIGNRLGMETPFLKPSYLLPFVYNQVVASLSKLFNLRYAQDIGHFLTNSLVRKI